MRRNITACPVCDHTLEVTEMACPACQTRLHGRFDRSPLTRLAPEHQTFIETFIQCRGIIRDVERALGVSYPTVRARLDNVVEALEDMQQEIRQEIAVRSSAARVASVAERSPAREARRRAILQQVETGDLEAEEAAEALRHT